MKWKCVYYVYVCVCVCACVEWKDEIGLEGGGADGGIGCVRRNKISSVVEQRVLCSWIGRREGP